jgi:hypothetical protein
MSEWGKIDFANNEPKYLQTNHPGNTDVYLVNASRLANATFGDGEAVAHQGWVKITQGSGFVKGVEVANVSSTLTYANAYLTFTGTNTTAANGQLVVLNGNQVSVAMNVVGAGYESAPTVSAGSSANNGGLVLTVVPGGRMGRVQSETLVTLSEPTVNDANSGLPYFTGV